jgi:sucrose phosphorylase
VRDNEVSTGSEPSGSRPSGPQLIAYADRLGGDLAGLGRLMRGAFDGAFDSVHVLPFYLPFDGADAGFDPQDHTRVDPRLGSWDDVRSLGESVDVMADVIVNHVSASSDRFADVVRNGPDSPWSDMFLTFDAVFPGGATEDELARIYRPRPGLPFTVMKIKDRPRLVWTTFTAQQIDLDVRARATWDYLTSVVDRLTDAGVRWLRLDAAGYVGKLRGTDCFLTPDALAFIRRLGDYARARGAQVLVEVHGHYRQQLDIADEVGLTYDFALPPLVLHALTARDLAPLARWLQIRPAECVTVLDTHDGIGIVDVGTSALRPGEPGLLSDAQLDALVEAIHTNSGGSSRLATGTAASNLDLYQVNCTFYDALGRDDRACLLARLLQLFIPGIPQVYYVGLLAGGNDLDLLRRTGIGRDVNRHHYPAAQVEAELRRGIVQAQLAALRLRRGHPAFGGTFTAQVEGTRIALDWRSRRHVARLEADVATCDLRTTFSGPNPSPETALRADAISGSL